MKLLRFLIRTGKKDKKVNLVLMDASEILEIQDLTESEVLLASLVIAVLMASEAIKAI